MPRYQKFAHNVQVKLEIAFDSALASIAVVLKSVGKTLTPLETRIMKVGLAPELYQIIVSRGVAQGDGRTARERDARQIVEAVAEFLEISPATAKQRVIVVFEELKADFSPWDDVTFLELVDAILAQVSEVYAPELPAAVA